MLDVIKFTACLQKLGSLEEGDACFWDKDELQVEKVGYIGKTAKAIRRLFCLTSENDTPYVPTECTLQKIANFLKTSQRLLRREHTEGLRKAKLFFAKVAKARPEFCQIVKVINAHLINFPCPVQIPAELVRKIADYDVTGESFRALRHVNLSMNHALPAHVLVETSFFASVCSGHRFRLCQFVHFLVALHKNNKPESGTLLGAFLQQATPKAQKTFWEYAFLQDFGSIEEILATCSDKIERLYYPLFPVGQRWPCFENLTTLDTASSWFLNDALENNKKLTCLRLHQDGEMLVADNPLMPLPEFLQELCLDVRFARNTLERMLTKLQAASRLQKLELTFPIELDLLGAMGRLTSLTDLTMYVNERCVDELILLVGMLPNLQRLSLVCDKEKVDRGFMGVRPIVINEAIALLEHCPQIVAIQIVQEECSVDQAQRLQEALRRAPKLETLKLTLSGAGVDTLWPALFQLPNLRSLFFNTDRKLPEVSVDQSELVELTLYNSMHSSLKVLPQLRKLQKVTLGHPLHRRIVDLMTLASCKKLQSLSFLCPHHTDYIGQVIQATYNGGFTANHFEILSRIKTLQELVYDFTPAAGEEVSDELLRLVKSPSQLKALSVLELPRQRPYTASERFSLFSEIPE